MTTLSEILNEAIPRWATLTGTKLGTNKYTFTIGSNSAFQSYDLQKYVEDLNAARALDLTGTTAILLLRGLFEAYVKEQAFNAHALLFAPEVVEDRLSKLREFRALISQPACEEAVTAFKEALRTATIHYTYDLSRLKDHLDDEQRLGMLRLAALKSCDSLKVHQFLQGKPDPAPLQYNREIFEFSNINSFIAALHKQWISGITLALVRDHDDTRGVFKAYFVLGMRNGENLTILTDHDEGPHPDYHSMTRRPERQLDARAQKHWFPYRLLDEDPVKRAKDKTALVSLDASAVAVDTISTLEPSEFVWLTLLFGLIVEKYGDDFKTDEVSYTGEMVVTPHALVDDQHALVKAEQYRPLVLEHLTTTTATVKRADNRTPVGHNAWMEERYRDRVPAIVLDVVGERKALDVGQQLAKLLPGEIDEIKQILPPERRQPGVIGWGPDYRTTPINPHALDPTYFGTKSAIDRNRTWAARNNMIQVVQRLAVAEFAAKQAMILSWYRKRIERNLPFILKAVARGELIAPTTRWNSDIHHGFPTKDRLIWATGNILQQQIAPTWHKAFPHRSAQGVLLGDWGSHASVFTIISPDNPKALALLCGISEKKVPWPLQHWTTHEPYTGNSILARIDPQDSRLDNPWRHLQLQLVVALGKREFNRLRKDLNQEKP